MFKSIYSNSRLLFATTIICGATLSACATKPDRRGPPPDRQGRKAAKTSGTFVKPIGLLFAGMDKNNDAIVTETELNAGIQTEWTNFDQNPSAVYFAQWSIAKLGSTDAFPTFMMFDKNINGVVSAIEFSEKLQSEFTRLDKNKDDSLERSEMLVAFEAPRGQSKPKSREGSDDKRGKGGRPPPR